MMPISLMLLQGSEWLLASDNLDRCLRTRRGHGGSGRSRSFCHCSGTRFWDSYEIDFRMNSLVMVAF